MSSDIHHYTRSLYTIEKSDWNIDMLVCDLMDMYNKLLAKYKELNVNLIVNLENVMTHLESFEVKIFRDITSPNSVLASNSDLTQNPFYLAAEERANLLSAAYLTQVKRANILQTEYLETKARSDILYFAYIKANTAKHQFVKMQSISAQPNKSTIDENNKQINIPNKNLSCATSSKAIRRQFKVM